MNIFIIFLSLIGLLKLVTLFLQIIIVCIKNNINKFIDNKLEKHYHEIQRNISCGICEWFHFIPTVKSTISSIYFETEIDIFLFYIFISYKIIDCDEIENES